jgi:DNA polymerase-3 subunit gamma/tau
LAYQVIARKWRPQIFEELVGQMHISQTLLNALRNDRTPHALLFTGPRGTGKTSTARILAKSLRCPKAKDFVPCGECSECQDIAQGRSIDVVEIDGASNNGVDAIRELRESVGFMPSSGRYKVYIIDEVHMLSGSAFNALLKTLEEPPSHVVFVMATTEVQKIPNTILSRCQRYDFRKIATRLIADHLGEICKKENVKAESEAIWAIARQGEGSMRDSQSLLDQVISFCDGQLTLAKVTDALGLTDRSLLTETLRGLSARDTNAIISVIEKIFESGYDPIIYMKDLLEELRHLLVVKLAPERAEDLVDLPNEEISRLKELAQGLSAEDVHLLFDMALKGASDLHRAQDTRVVLEMILLRLSIAPRIQDLSKLASGAVAVSVPTTVAAPVQTMTAPPKAAPIAQPSAPAPASAPMPPVVGSLSERWNDFVDRVRKVNGLIAAQLDQLHLLAINGQELVIGVSEKHQFLQSQVNDTNFQKKLVNYLNTFWGPGHSIKVQTADSQKAAASLNPVALQEKKKQDEHAALVKKVEDHPLVREAKSIFNTQIKSIRGSQS